MNARLPIEVLAASTLALCAACASTPEQTAEPREAKVYQTGSAIPVRDHNGIADVKSVAPESLHQELNSATHPTPVGGTGR
ncbi:MAG: hypothetical protein ACM3QY_13295 [Candidatus Levyibacteriota bacterium]